MSVAHPKEKLRGAITSDLDSVTVLHNLLLSCVVYAVSPYIIKYGKDSKTFTDYNSDLELNHRRVFLT